MSISVIVPVYKVEPYLRRCIDSILAQTYTNLEVILVDDGSPDNCPAICDEYATLDSRVHVIHKRNGGLSDARNAGIEVARGEWFSFIDSDDWIEPEMYDVLLENAERCTAQISVGGVNDEVIIDGDVRITKTTLHDVVKEEVLSPSEAMKRYFTGSWSAWDKIYHRELFHDVRYPISEINEDEAIVLQLLEQCHHIVYTNKVFYHYIRRPASITNSVFTEKKLAWYRHCKANLEWIQQHHQELEPYAAIRLCGSIIWSLTEIALANQLMPREIEELLSSLSENYALFRKVYKMGLHQDIRLMILHWLPYDIYRHLIRLKRSIM